MSNSKIEEESKQKICFVVMGFGKKVDFESSRTLDLDATFTTIIKPTCEEMGYTCVRADEINQSGLIDVKMYKMLLEADLVIADISTSNANAIYELGVRHALKRKATILMKEQGCRFYFDLDHVSTINYRHLNEDIGFNEVIRVRQKLKDVIANINYDDEEPDSPVYTYLPELQSPVLSKQEYETIIHEMEVDDDLYFHLKSKFDEYVAHSKHAEAVSTIEELLKLRPNDDYFTQQLALHTYKSKSPDELTALVSASVIIDKLKPDDSNNPETTGIAGAIFKRLFSVTKDLKYLDKAIKYYQRGFVLKKDYYNGENLANCYSLKAKAKLGSDNIFYERLTKETRIEVLDRINILLDTENFNERSDKLWVYATASNLHENLGNEEAFKRFEMLFLEEKPSDWQKRTFYENLKH